MIQNFQQMKFIDFANVLEELLFINWRPWRIDYEHLREK